MLKVGRFESSSVFLSENPFSVSRKLSSAIDEKGSSLIEHELHIQSLVGGNQLFSKKNDIGGKTFCKMNSRRIYFH